MPTIGLFGYGSFGKLLAKYLCKYAAVKIYDPKTPKNLPGKCEPATLEDAAACDYVILAVPLPQLEQLLKNIASHLEDEAMVIDTTSVKVKPVELMLKYVPKTVQVLATHPLFGPQSVKNGLKGHTIVIHPTRIDDADKVIGFLRKLGLKVVNITPEEHDKQMATIHALTFFIARGLVKMNLPIPKTPLATPSYKKLLDLAELESHHSKDLFDTIEKGNPYANSVRQEFVNILEELDKRTSTK